MRRKFPENSAYSCHSNAVRRLASAHASVIVTAWVPFAPDESISMKRVLVVLAVLSADILGLGLAPAVAADAQSRPQIARSDVLPFPRSERAASVWASGTCWTECGSYCAWGLVGCLERDTQGRCLKLTDRCDRYCQRNCRTAGGPLIGLIE